MYQYCICVSQIVRMYSETDSYLTAVQLFHTYTKDVFKTIYKICFKRHIQNKKIRKMHVIRRDDIQLP